MSDVSVPDPGSSDRVSRVAGILVGGESSRMGGKPKGLLRDAAGEVLVERTARLFEAIGARVVLLGGHADYDVCGRTRIGDAVGVEGPLSGLAALLAADVADRIFLVACDMPRLEESLVRRLDAEARGVPAAAPWCRDHWEPLFSVFDARSARAAVRAVRSPSALLTKLDARRILLSDAERGALVDWDTPDDIRRALPA